MYLFLLKGLSLSNTAPPSDVYQQFSWASVDDKTPGCRKLRTEPRNSWRSGSHSQFFTCEWEETSRVEKRGWWGGWRKGLVLEPEASVETVSRRQIGLGKRRAGGKELDQQWQFDGGIEVCWLVCHFDTSWRHLRKGSLNWENAFYQIGSLLIDVGGPSPQATPEQVVRVV